MNIVTGSLFNEARRKPAGTDGGQALLTKKRRSQNKSQLRGHNKSRGRSKSKGRAFSITEKNVK